MGSNNRTDSVFGFDGKEHIEPTSNRTTIKMKVGEANIALKEGRVPAPRGATEAIKWGFSFRHAIALGKVCLDDDFKTEYVKFMISNQRMDMTKDKSRSMDRDVLNFINKHFGPLIPGEIPDVWRVLLGHAFKTYWGGIKKEIRSHSGFIGNPASLDGKEEVWATWAQEKFGDPNWKYTSKSLSKEGASSIIKQQLFKSGCTVPGDSDDLEARLQLQENTLRNIAGILKNNSEKERVNDESKLYSIKRTIIVIKEMIARKNDRAQSEAEVADLERDDPEQDEGMLGNPMDNSRRQCSSVGIGGNFSPSSHPGHEARFDRSRELPWTGRMIAEFRKRARSPDEESDEQPRQAGRRCCIDIRAESRPRSIGSPRQGERRQVATPTLLTDDVDEEGNNERDGGDNTESAAMLVRVGNILPE